MCVSKGHIGNGRVDIRVMAASMCVEVRNTSGLQPPLSEIVARSRCRRRVLMLSTCIVFAILWW